MVKVLLNEPMSMHDKLKHTLMAFLLKFDIMYFSIFVILKLQFSAFKGVIECKMHFYMLFEHNGVSHIKPFTDSWQNDVVLHRPLPRLLIDSVVSLWFLAETGPE